MCRESFTFDVRLKYNGEKKNSWMSRRLISEFLVETSRSRHAGRRRKRHLSSILLHCTQMSRVGVTREEGEDRSRRRSSSRFVVRKRLYESSVCLFAEIERPVHRDARSSLIVDTTNVALNDIDVHVFFF